MASCGVCGKSGILLKTLTLQNKDYCDACAASEFDKLTRFYKEWVIVPDAKIMADRVANEAATKAKSRTDEAELRADHILSIALEEAERARNDANHYVNEAKDQASRIIASANLDAEKAKALIVERKRDADLAVAAAEQQLAAMYDSAAKSFKFMAEVTAAKAISLDKSRTAQKGLISRAMGIPALRKAVQNTFIAFDVETTGLRKYDHRITEIGAIKVENGVEVSRFAQLINPKMPIPQEVQELTGITDEMVADAPEIKEVLPAFFEFIQDHPIVAHNASFDLGFLDEEMRRAGFSKQIQYADTLSMARRAFPGMINYRLGTLAKLLAVTSGTAHRAIGDCETLHSLVLRIVEEE